jgi:hypothetical protein
MNWNECGHAIINQSQRLIPSQSLAKINETLKPVDTCIFANSHTKMSHQKQMQEAHHWIKLQQGHTFNLCPQRGPSTTLQLYSMSFHGQNIKCGPNGPCLCEDTFKIISKMFDKKNSATLIEMNMVIPLWINHKCSNHHNH